jgi:nitroreductase
MLNANIFDIIKTRRSIRHFLEEPVKKEHLLKIIEAATMAPSATNSQNWQFIAVESEQKKKQLAEIVKNQVALYTGKIKSPKARSEFSSYSRYFTFFEKAPLVLCVVQTPYVSLSINIMKRYGASDTSLGNAAVQGPSAAIQNILLSAHALGYGACWMTGPLIAKEELEKVLNINPENELLAIIPIGKTDLNPQPPKRKALEEIFKTM